MWIDGADNDVDRGQTVAGNSSACLGHHPFWRHVNHSGVGRLEVASVLNSWPNLCGDACRQSLIDPCHLREESQPVISLLKRSSSSQRVVYGGIHDGSPERRCNDRCWIDGWM